MGKVFYSGIIESKAVVEDLQKIVSEKKYQLPTEKSFEDVISRVIRHTKDRYKPYSDIVKFEKVEQMLRDGFFIPAGSILSGIGNNYIKCSLSNCYVTPIENDSLESIFDCLSKSARTFSYRGGSGTDITVLRPSGMAVNNAAKSSSGAVSFMPLLSEVTNTIGQSGRRAAQLLSIDIRHPDVMRFIWSKSKPEEVFGKDFLTGKIPDVYGANISVKLTDAFMNAVKNNEMWTFVFPDRDADPELYDNYWNGVYEDWENIGGVLKTYETKPAIDVMREIAESAWISADPGVLFSDAVIRMTPGASISHKLRPITTNPCFAEDTLIATSEGPQKIKDLVGKTVTIFDGDNWVECDNFRVTGTEQKLIRLNLSNGSYLDVTPYHTMYLESGEKVIAGELKSGDCLEYRDYTSCGFVDNKIVSVDKIEGKHTVYCCTVKSTHKLLTSLGILSGNCGEQPIGPYNNCLLGALVLSKYVNNKFKSDASFDFDRFLDDVKNAVVFMNVMSDINNNLHPLLEQREADRYGRRIGIEFTALADMLAMMNIKYGSNESIKFVRTLMKSKAIKEIETSIEIAKHNGSCEAIFETENRHRFINNEYIKSLELDDSMIADILEYGLANTAFNTVGPTGSISIMSNNCTSGIEPLFMFSYSRQTRLDPGKYFNMLHKPVIDYLLENYSQSELEEGIDLDDLKESLNYVESYELDWKNRVLMQSVVQAATDSSISSTVNLPNSSTVEDIIGIYLEAWEKNLKGITVFRDGCKKGVLSSGDSETKEPEVIKSESYEESSKILIKSLLDEERARRFRVWWKGAKVYIIVTLDDEDNPLEVFAKLPREVGINGDGLYSEEHFQEKYSLWEAVTRMVSLLLRSGMPVEKIVHQLDKSRYSVTDAASILCRILRKYIHNVSEDHTDEEIVANNLGAKCVECGKMSYVYENGCGSCRSCGYTYCG